MMKFVFASLIFLGLGAVAWFFIGMWIKEKWPARIPDELRFEHDISSDLKLRAIAERLAEQCKDFNSEEVVCLGAVRGTAARVLFHAGPKNRGRNKSIHRNDYILHVQRLSKTRVRLRLDINTPYSYFRINRNEVEALVRALEKRYK